MRENAGKMWTRITPNMDTFYAVIVTPVTQYFTVVLRKIHEQLIIITQKKITQKLYTLL